ncbi:MAG: iron-containing redox enzyme family protein [Actinomycetota bacterium]
MNALSENLPGITFTLDDPALPAARGPISSALLACLKSPPGSVLAVPEVEGDPLSDDDLHLALYVCYELHYRGFAGVDALWEWQPALLEFTRVLETAFEHALRAEYFTQGSERVEVRLQRIAEKAGPPLSPYLRRKATIEQFKEFVIHRSAYQLKEADPHTFAIPRLEGKAKAAMVEIQFDEYGSGNPARMHSTLFRNTMEALGLDCPYGHYLNHIPGVTLATVNLLSMFAIHRRWRGAATGHMALFEMTSSQPNRRYGDGLRRLGFGPDATGFYDEHVVADSVHEAIALHDLAGSLAAQEPGLADDIVFGAAACEGLDSLFARYLLKSWSEGRSSLRSI